jgi:ubiquitin thioesterase protein OTUB1
LEEELARMTSLNNLLITAGGFQEWLFEDMVEETLALLRDLADSIQDSPQIAEEILIQRFNSAEVSNAIVYHLRLLATSWLKGNPAPYQDFIQGDLGLDGYCKEWLEAPNQEIDHLGLMLLIDVLLKPIGFAVEVIYLDRSEGSQVNTHMFQNEDVGVPTNPNGPIIHLLYRPSHYDILYKDLLQPRQSISDAVRNPNIQVNRATNFTHRHNVQSTPQSLHGYSNLDMSALLSIPGFGCAPAPSHHGLPSTYASVEQQPYSGSPISASISPVSSGTSPGATSNLSLSTQFPPQHPANFASPALSTPHSAHPTFPTTTQLPIHNHLPQSHPHRPSLSTRSASLSHAPLSSHPSDISSPSSASSFRPSKYEWAAAADWQEGPVVFQTSTFKNSHYNTAHYNNPNFQPEEWTPESEEAEKSAGRKRST